jgi:hypothetical protein
LGRNDTSLAESAAQQLKVWLLEESLGRSLRVGGVGDDDIELVLLVLEELEAVADNGLGLGVVEANGHAGKVFLGKTNDGLVDIAENGLLDAVVLDDFTEDTTVTTADDEDVFGVGVGVHGKVSDHLLVAVPMSVTLSVLIRFRKDVRELIALSALDDVVENEDHAVVGGLEDEDVLVQALLVVDDLLDLEGHGLTRPHAGDLTEPAIYQTC